MNAKGEILLLRRRKNGIGGGKWDLPGGLLEEGETPEDGLRREVMEETGLEIGELVPIYTHGAIPRKIGRYCVWIWFKTDVTSETVRLDAENSEYQWVSRPNVLQIEDELLPSVHKKAVRALK